MRHYIPGALLITPTQHADARGRFLEWYRADHLGVAGAHPIPLAQANISVSARGAVRGAHLASMPPGQAKYVTCVRGAVLDFILDVRVGSPTFAQYQAYNPATDREIYPLDPPIGLKFLLAPEDLLLSAKDP
ncbi:MAG: dTDP-4-dehydrorhamnose 3,5-epimerase family protein, partial [Longispora sp.]|nr:dTDP-4-dehydrorhamnose 3,5-epimerase family protein [Longispora sp. (in: high G+C Gram-positive bacteria)]